MTTSERYMDIEVSANPRPSFWKSGFSKFSAALCFFISVGSVAMVAAADDGYVMLENGVYCRTADGRMRVEFVSPDIVRVRYTREADFLGNGTIVCVERTENKVPFQVASVSGGLSLQSDSLEVRVDLNTCALTYKDARTGKVLLSERQDMPREAEKTYMENVVYDPDSTRWGGLGSSGIISAGRKARRFTVWDATWKISSTCGARRCTCASIT